MGSEQSTKIRCRSNLPTMPDSLLYSEDTFVVLEAGQPEQFLSPEELQQKLEGILQASGENLPRELEKIENLPEKAKYLRDNFCEFDVGGDGYLQWYVVRLEK